MKKLLIIMFLIIFILSCNTNKRESIKDNLGNIYYDVGTNESIDFATGETNYYTNYLYVSKSGQYLLNINTNKEYNPVFAYKYSYDSNNKYVFTEMVESDGNESWGIIFNKNRLLFTRGFYDSSEYKEYKLLNNTNELYSFIKDLEGKGGLYYYGGTQYQETNFINGKEPYQKRFNDYQTVKKDKKNRLKSYSQLEKDFKDLSIIERYSYKFAVLYEDYDRISIACKIEDIIPVSTLLIDPWGSTWDGSYVGDDSREMQMLSMRFDKYYAYADFMKFKGVGLISVQECPVCHKNEYELEREAMEKYGDYNGYYSKFRFNIDTHQYECYSCYSEYYIGSLRN